MEGFIDSTYWIAMAHLPKWTIERINQAIITIVHEKKVPLEEFFTLDVSGWRELFGFTDKELRDLQTAKADLPRIAFIAEQLHNEGFQVIPMNAKEYPVVLKENLKAKNSPPVVYTFGRTTLLQEDAVAIVGSREAGTKALEFADYVAKKTVREFKVVVSGFAKGVDKQALDSTLEVHGKSIIVLPQGILTFQSGFKKYYEPIVNGDVLVFSTFFPKAGWEVGLAMARNTYIYGLAKEIYVAESDVKGGTWQGAIDGMNRKRNIYVRMPDEKETNANLKLIRLGGIPVDLHGELIAYERPAANTLFDLNNEPEQINEPETGYSPAGRNIEKEIIALLKDDAFTSKEIKLALKLDWDSRKLTSFLKKNPNFKTLPGKPVKYSLSNGIHLSLFK